MYSRQALYRFVCLGINQQRSARNQLDMAILILNIIQLKDFEQIFAAWSNMHK